MEERVSGKEVNELVPRFMTMATLSQTHLYLKKHNNTTLLKIQNRQ